MTNPSTAGTTATASGAPVPHFQVAVIGTGFAGVCAGIKLKGQRMHDFVIFEADDDIGGTWNANHYPGCACDVPSHLYSFSFEQNPDWSESFSTQPEIKAYLQRCVRTYGLGPHIRLNEAVTAMQWDEQLQVWRLTSSKGDYTAQFLIAGIGPLSEPSEPEIPGLENFRGETWHSARWNHDYDLRGKRVAVIGTGASAIQFIPQIQPQVEQLYVYQRTPAYVLPKLNRAITGAEKLLYRTVPAAQKLSRAGIYWPRESYVIPFAYWMRPLAAAEALFRRTLRKQVSDPELRRKLTPNYRLGCKRTLLANDYYPALDQPNTELLTGGITEVTETGVRTDDGTEREVDAIILGTGFKVTSFSAMQFVWGKQGRLLADSWSEGMQAYLGSTVHGFPNLFFVIGPNTGLGHTSMIYMIESQMRYIMDGLRTATTLGLSSLEVGEEHQRRYNEQLQRDLAGTVWTEGGCTSWYLDNEGRNTTLWPDFTFTFMRRTRSFDLGAYEAVSAAQRSRSAATSKVASG